EMDFDFDLKYHLGKTNVVVHALSRKVLYEPEFMMHKCSLYEDTRDLNFDVTDMGDGIMYPKLVITRDLRLRIAHAQEMDMDLDLRRRLGQSELTLAPDGVELF
ncbi:hypothetical protein A2U01_0019609, partial [Trifolium medium]|nr:hypothetical protein [Trifolium medium]